MCVRAGEFSPCRVNNGGCQDLCLLTSDGRVNCSCRGERKLLEDNTCIGEILPTNHRLNTSYVCLCYYCHYNTVLTDFCPSLALVHPTKAFKLQKEIVKVIACTMLIVGILCPSAQNTSCSSMDDFECGNGDCIKYTLTCDGMAHCKDKSDEKQSYCSECVCVL